MTETTQGAKATLPSRSLVDQSNPMPYVNAASTDIRATFARALKQLTVGPPKAPRPRSKR